jgi:DNA-binding MarR family transcriptional regulator
MHDAYDGRIESRITQLLGVVALAAVDRLRDAFVHAAGGDTPLDETSVNELAAVVGRSQPATVRLVDRCVQRGWMRRGAGPDRRTLALSLTDPGRRLVHEILVARSDALGAMLAPLHPAERADLERVLASIATRLADDRPGATHACRLCDRNACTSGPGCPMQHTVTPDAPGL